MKPRGHTMKRWAIAAVACALALTACSGAEEPTATPSTTAAETPSPTPTPPPEPVPSGCTPAPFTGLPADGSTPSAVVGVKIENSANARPQSSLENADIVFVEMVEGGMTRFLAIYNSTYPQTVGPVRSLRPTDAGILGQWSGSATLFYSGGISTFESMVQNAGIPLVTEGATGFYREKSRKMPHNLYVNLADGVSVLAAPDACPTGLFQYLDTQAGEVAPAGTPVSVIRAKYPSARSGWQWNAGTGLWERYDDGVANVSASSGAVLTATNVVVLTVETFNRSERDPAGTPVPETVLEGTGALSYFMNGQQFTGTWSKAGVNSPFEFFDANGAPVRLMPGNTWVELLPTSGQLSVE